MDKDCFSLNSIRKKIYVFIRCFAVGAAGYKLDSLIVKRWQINVVQINSGSQDCAYHFDMLLICFLY